MQSKNFIPFKLYSHGSVLTSINKIDQIVKYIKDNNYEGGVLCDLENVFLAVEFYKAMKKKGLKPGIGCGLTIDNVKAITLVCKNKTGWKNLLNLIHLSYLNNNLEPYIKRDQLDGNTDGLICLAGSPYSWSSVEEHDYIDLFLCLVEKFKNNIYIEVHQGYKYISDVLSSLTNLDLIACSDGFYLNEDEKILNDILIATKLKKKLDDLEVKNHFLVKNSFKISDVSNLIDNDCSYKVFSKIEDLDLLSEPMLPQFGVDNPADELKKICYTQFENLNLSQQHKDRLDHELNVINEAGFDSYFLIVQDVIKYAKSQNMLIGGCRGCLCSSNNVFMYGGKTKKINKVLLGDMVISSDGLPHKVTDTFMYSNQDKIYNIKTYYGDYNGLRVTPDHKILTEVGWKRADKISLKDRIFIPKVDSTKTDNSLASYKIAYINGLFTGDGWIERAKKNVAFIIFGLKDISSLTKLCNYLSSLGYSYSIRYRSEERVYIVSIKSKTFYDYFKYTFSDYNYSSKTKHVPKYIFDSDSRIVREYLRGYSDADGTTRKNGTVKYTTISKRLAYEIKYLHTLINKPCSISNYKTDNRNEYDIKSTEIGRLATYKDNGIYVKVRSIEIEEPEMYVYDLEVEGCHNYLTTNGIVHNSVGGSITSYLSEITDIDPLRYGLIFERFYNPSRNYEPHISFSESDYVEYKNENI